MTTTVNEFKLCIRKLAGYEVLTRQVLDWKVECE